MDNSSDSYDLSLVDQLTLTGVVSQLLNIPNVAISDWSYERLDGGAGEWGDYISSPYLFTGKANALDGEYKWSLILKVVGTKAIQDDPSDALYWKREVLAYQSGELAGLPGKLAAPYFFGIYTFSEKVIGLWLEYVADDFVSNWSLEHYGIVARYLGEFNGTFLTMRQSPESIWLSREWFHQIVEDDLTIDMIERLRQPHDQPAVRHWFKEGNDTRILQLWDEREMFIKALDRLPQTLVHRDAFRRNLFIKHDQVVAIDWAQIGIDAIGVELVSLVISSCFHSEFRIGNIRELAHEVFDAYLQGLADAGWHGEPRLVRLGFTAGSAMVGGLSYVWFDPPKELVPVIESDLNMSIEKIRINKQHIRDFALELADEARQLMASLQFK